ncbi:hypothetical protein [Paraburkholderia phenazinium]|jgi:hypothetical protein|uniref:Uncharacterized protein n=1 Tax=Paraburkholderia phenazinium TaxID=60549 RepID=A0A1G7W5N6_9BURK|nr:hypothetical protein [Paraburkholderia phenazinium]SDG67089.1 hypothetical protein SAMN05216466_104405 [Paraburkholderia phenazinium]
MAAAILRQHRHREAVHGFAATTCSLLSGAKRQDPTADGHATSRHCGIATPTPASVVQGNGHSVQQTYFLCSDDRALPLYGSMKDAPEGLYLGLLHGRNHLDSHLDKLGYPGPAIGPLRHVRTAYAAHLYLRFADWATAKLFFPGACAPQGQDPVIGLQDEIVIDIVESTIPYDGRFFGDWTVFYHAACVGEPHGRCG